jgi:Rrf2 family protein
MFILHKETDYALLTLEVLRGKQEFIPLGSLISQTHMPKRFLARITTKLVAHGILESKEGRSGGYKLHKDPEKINLYDFFRIFENDISFIKCQKEDITCFRKNNCQHQRFLALKLKPLFEAQLQNFTVADAFEK